MALLHPLYKNENSIKLSVTYLRFSISNDMQKTQLIGYLANTLSSIDLVGLGPFISLISRYVDGQEMQFELDRLEIFIKTLSRQFETLDSRFNELDDNKEFDNFLYDLMAKAKSTSRPELIKAYSGLFSSAIESGNLRNSEFAFSILKGFTEHHLVVLKFMYSNLCTLLGMRML